MSVRPSINHQWEVAYGLSIGLMTLNVIAPILRYFTDMNSIAMQADYVTVESIMSAKYRLPIAFGQN